MSDLEREGERKIFKFQWILTEISRYVPFLIPYHSPPYGFQPGLIYKLVQLYFSTENINNKPGQMRKCE